MKVGIITYHHTTNYGATLQAYALYQSIKSRGCSVEIINYQPYKAVKKYIQVLYLNSPKSQVLQNVLKSWKMREFLHSETKVSKDLSFVRGGLKKISKKYDAVIAGSDEVWNINSFRDFDPSYFLDFVCHQSTKKISYAASFGSTQVLGENQAKIKELIGEFDNISVRDTNSLKIITEICGKRAVRVLDPTFLWNYSQIMSNPKVEEDYILVYGFFNEKEAQAVCKLAKAQKMPIISVGYFNDCADKNLVTISPREWLGYFARAKYIFTTFYHGVIFSIIFKKPFIVFSKQDKSIKINDLLEYLNLGDRIYDSSKNNEIEIEKEELLKIDYNLISPILEEEILLSNNYISQVIYDKN